MKSLIIRLTFVLAILFGTVGVTAPVFAQVDTPTPPPTFEVIPDASARTNMPGNLVTYTLTIRNLGASEDSFTMALSGGIWPGELSSTSSGTVTAGATTTFTVSVFIPGNAATGSSDVKTVTVTSANPANNPISLNLTTSSVAATPTLPASATRPLITMRSYDSGGAITGGQQFDLKVVFVNSGKTDASNVVITFTGSDFLPRSTGGVIALPALNDGEDRTVTQPMTASAELAYKTMGTITVNISYVDYGGTAYTETFTISIPVKQYTGVAGPTATPTTIARPQLVVSGYATDIDPLQPGTTFNLQLTVRNLGTANAKSVTMVLGGGVTPDAQGTPAAGGMSGGGSELTNFAPLGSSNLVFIGDVTKATDIETNVRLIVNTTTLPGAYPLKLSFVYDDEKGNRLVDDQVITLLVYSLPKVEISFYSDPGFFYAGQMTMLPIQINNLGRTSAILGNLKVSAENAELMNNTSLVGTLEPGGYFTFDAQIMPYQAGPLDIEFSINYTDDFNQPRTFTQVITVEVQEMMIEPTPEGFPGEEPEIPATERPFLERLLMGLFGLDSAPTLPAASGNILPGDMNIPLDGGKESVPVYGGKG